MSKENYGVHIAHCCYIHGCKYGDKNCPVASGEVAQKHLCYDCEEEYESYTLEEIELLRKTKSYRPTYKQLKDKITDLEVKLAEKDEVFHYAKLEWEACLHKNCEEHSVFIKKLSQQLAEKEKEIESWKHKALIDMDYKELLELKLATYEDEVKNRGTCGLCEKLDNQEKISFAVEQLEKVKELAQIETEFVNSCELVRIYNLFEIINNQIKQLKEGM